MTPRLTAPALAAFLLAAAVACGGDDSGTEEFTPPPTQQNATPLEQAQAITDAFYEENEAVLLAMLELGDETEEQDRTFDPADDCDGIHEPMTDDEKGMLVLFVGQVLQDDGTDVATFAGKLEDYRQAIEATGVCP